MHQYVQKSLETFLAPKLSRTTTITKAKKLTYFQVLKNAFFTTKILHLLAQSTTETFQLTIHCLTWTLFMISFDYIPIYIFIYTNIHLYLYLYFEKQSKNVGKETPKYG